MVKKGCFSRPWLFVSVFQQQPMAAGTEMLVTIKVISPENLDVCVHWLVAGWVKM